MADRWRYLYCSAPAAAVVPKRVWTVTPTVPVPAGAIAVIELAEVAVKPCASVSPNFTAVASARFDPLILTAVPPADGPSAGAIPLAEGDEP